MSAPAATVRPTLRPDRVRVALAFLVNGALFGSWVARIPVVAADLDLAERQLGTALLGIAVATVVALPVAGGLTGRIGARPVTASGAVIAAVGLALVPLASGTASLFAALLVLGAGVAAMDASMNAQGVALERRYGRPIVVSFHGVWSVGGLVGTGLGAVLVRMDVGTAAHLVGAALVLGALGVPAAATSPAADVDREPDGQRVFALPRRGLWVLGGIAFASALTEGAVADWSGVFLRDVVGTSAAVAPLGFVAFAGTMATARFLGDRIIRRAGRTAVVGWGGGLAAAGLGLVVAAPSVLASVVGFAAVGAGLAAVVPVCFSAAGQVPGIAQGEGVAAVATVGYAGFLAGPPVIGFVADAADLRLSLALVALAVTTLVPGSRALGARRRPRPA